MTCLILAAGTAVGQPVDGGPMSFDGGFAVSTRLDVDPLNAIAYPLSNGNGLRLSVIGSEGLVVWKDDRDYQNMLYASRISAQGQVLDPGGLRLVQSVSQGWGVVPFGANHLVFTVSTSSPYSLLAYRVSAQGVLLDATPIRVVTNLGLDYPVGAACTAQMCLFAWAGFNGFKSARLSAQGVALDPAGVTLSPVSSNNGSTQSWVATDGTDFLATTRLAALADGGLGPLSTVTARVLAATGQSTGLNTVSWSAVYGASLAGSPAGYLLGSKTASGPFVLMRLNPSGAAIDATPISIPNASSDYEPQLVFSGSSYWAIWRELGAGSTTFKAVAIAPSGAMGAPPVKTLLTSTGTGSFDFLHDAASATAGFWLGLAHGTPVTTENLPTLNRFDASGVGKDGYGVPIRLLPSTQQHPSLSWGTSCYMAVWEDNASSFLSRGIYARRFDAAGQPLDAVAFRLVGATPPQRSPHVAFDGQNFLVVWTEGAYGSQSIRGARVSQSGAVVDAQGFSVSPTGVNAIDGRVAFTGGVYGVLWQTVVGDDMKFQRVSPAGQVLDVAPIDVRVNFATQSGPALYANGSSFLALWLDSELSYSQVYGARITAQGVVQDRPPINVSARPASGNNVGDFGPSAAFGGQQWLVVYNTQTSSEVATRLSASGQVLEALRPLSFPGAADYSPSVTAFDGQRFRYLWARSTGPATVRFGSWNTSADAGLQAAGSWEERMDDLAWAQSSSDSALLLSAAPNLGHLPNLPRVFRRAVRFCAPGSACPPPVLTEDAGVSPVVDAGPGDAGVIDAGTGDAGLSDAGPSDSGGSDGSVDSGTAPADAGTQPDAGASIIDAGSVPGEPDQAGGCGCGTSGAPGGLVALGLLLTALRGHLRRKTRGEPGPQ